MPTFQGFMQASISIMMAACGSPSLTAIYSAMAALTRRFGSIRPHLSVRGLAMNDSLIVMVIMGIFRTLTTGRVSMTSLVFAMSVLARFK